MKTALLVLDRWITFQGFVRQGDCHASLGENREAAKAFGEALKRAESDEEKATILSQILALGVSLEGLVVFALLVSPLMSRDASNKLHGQF